MYKNTKIQQKNKKQKSVYNRELYARVNIIVCAIGRCNVFIQRHDVLSVVFARLLLRRRARRFIFYVDNASGTSEKSRNSAVLH